MIPHFLKHYKNLVDHFFIYDNGSDDTSIKLLKNEPKVSLNEFAVRGESFVLEALDFYNNVWKQSRGIADWVILCNIDEFFYHPKWHKHLKHHLNNKVTIIPAIGYHMISENFPKDSLLSITKAINVSNFNKIACFNPNQIEEINFTPGRHQANPIGNVMYPKKNKVKLLHYKHLSVSYIIKRYHELGERLKKIDRERNYGHHYHKSPKQIEEEFDKNLKGAKTVFTIYERLCRYLSQ